MLYDWSGYDWDVTCFWEGTDRISNPLNPLEAKARAATRSGDAKCLSSRIEATQDTNDDASCGDGNWEEHCVPSSIKEGRIAPKLSDGCGNCVALSFRLSNTISQHGEETTGGTTGYCPKRVKRKKLRPQWMVVICCNSSRIVF